MASDMNSSSLIAVVTEGVEGGAVAGVETFFSCLTSGSGSAAFLFLEKSTVVKIESGRCLDRTKQRRRKLAGLRVAEVDSTSVMAEMFCGGFARQRVARGGCE